MPDSETSARPDPADRIKSLIPEKKEEKLAVETPQQENEDEGSAAEAADDSSISGAEAPGESTPVDDEDAASGENDAFTGLLLELTERAEKAEKERDDLRKKNEALVKDFKALSMGRSSYKKEEDKYLTKEDPKPDLGQVKNQHPSIDDFRGLFKKGAK